MGAFPGFTPIDLPEEVDLDAAAHRLGGDAVYIDRSALQRIAGERILRYDLTLPLLLTVRWEGAARRLSAAGKAYRLETENATHLQAFHQLELFLIDDRRSVDPFWLAGRILHAVDLALPRTEVRMTPTDYPMCARAWSLDVRPDPTGEWIEVLAWGEYADWVLDAMGADPRRQVALGAGFGLERIAALRHGIDDIRKIATGPGGARLTGRPAVLPGCAGTCHGFWCNPRPATPQKKRAPAGGWSPTQVGPPDAQGTLRDDKRLVVMVVFVLPVQALAQRGDSGSIVGHVFDQTGAPLSGVKVTATSRHPDRRPAGHLQQRRGRLPLSGARPGRVPGAGRGAPADHRRPERRQGGHQRPGRGGLRDGGGRRQGRGGAGGGAAAAGQHHQRQRQGGLRHRRRGLRRPRQPEQRVPADQQLHRRQHPRRAHPGRGRGARRCTRWTGSTCSASSPPCARRRPTRSRPPATARTT